MLSSDRIRTTSKCCSCGSLHIYANFAGLFFVVLQKISFSRPYSGDTMRSAFFKCSVKCPAKLPAVAVTATSLPRITLMAIRQKQFDIFVFNHNAVLQGLTSSGAYYFVVCFFFNLSPNFSKLDLIWMGLSSLFKLIAGLKVSPGR